LCSKASAAPTASSSSPLETRCSTSIARRTNKREEEEEEEDVVVVVGRGRETGDFAGDMGE
jgi:hypothetical protein